MDLMLKRFLFIFILICPYILVFCIMVQTGPVDPLNTALRFCGLFGFLSLSLGVFMNLLKKELKTILGQPFINIHHIFVLTGLILITLHPVIFALSIGTLSFFIPDFTSFPSFSINIGRIAIILIYIGFLAALLRTVLKRKWVTIHRIVYLAFVLAIIHANLIGEDLSNPVIRILYDGIACGIIITGIIKIRQRHSLK